MSNRKISPELRKKLSVGCRERFLNHGYARGTHPHPLYLVHKNLKQRCRNPKNPQFKNYGARGISYDPRWEKFSAFLEDMGGTYRPGLTLDRRNNSKGYCRENCHWVSQHAQMQNLRTNWNLSFRGETLSVSEWARRLGMTRRAIVARLERGWKLEHVLTLGSRLNKARVSWKGSYRDPLGS